MSTETPFIQFLRSGNERGGFQTDDVLASILPLMEQLRAAHEAGQVGPLEGTEQLLLKGHQLAVDPAHLKPPRKNGAEVEQLQMLPSQGVSVIGASQVTNALDQGTIEVSSLDIQEQGSPMTKPVYLPGYISWEHAIAHHDALTDIYSLGLLLASLSCGFDFTEREDVELFAANRSNLFAVNERLNPVVASVIMQMTELNRHKRAQDLGAIIRRLENYREQPEGIDYTEIPGFKESSLGGRRKLIQTHLRDRLFEISRRNRLIYFKPTLHTLNLTVSSVPVLLDYRSIRLDQLFVWHPALAETIASGAPISLNKYLRFEDAPYISGVLDKIISEARRDRAEYGFAQLRLVLCFLRWHNLKEEPGERINSPLLMLPVELTRKKGVRDHYVLDPTTSEAEVNPALRHHLKELYNLDLPESIDLRETTLDAFHQLLLARIQATEPGVMLNKIDQPQIELIHERARQRLDQYKRRLKKTRQPVPSITSMDYSYERENYRPLGLKLFHEKVRPAPAPLRNVAGAPPAPRLPNIVQTGSAPEDSNVLETERQMFALHEGDGRNPYSWDFDLCSITLGNFNYRKMTLVRDYANLIETDSASAAFDNIFSLAPKRAEELSPAPLELGEQHLIIPCDATQASAIARARSGHSYIIQGPPGTGKSQTITNLIADYVARGKRVLFVCEKRAAIDVVFHRLRQQGLDELCCLIHDSQTDKKEFIQNLKQTYEKLLSHSGEEDHSEKAREANLRLMEQDLATLERFSEAMRHAPAQAGVRLRELLHRLVELRGRDLHLTSELEEQVPDYALWLQYSDLVLRLTEALQEMGQEPCFAKHPLRWLGKTILESERPVELLSSTLERAEGLLDAVESALELTALPGEWWDTVAEIEVLLSFAARIKPLSEKGLLGILDPESATARGYATLESDLAAKRETLEKAKLKTTAWIDPLSPDDAQNALLQARALGGSMLRFLQPAFWRLRKTLHARYDFSKHAVAPAWEKILADLVTCQNAQAAYDESISRARQQWQTLDVDEFRACVAAIRANPEASHPSVRALTRNLLDGAQSRDVVANLSDIHAQFAELNRILKDLLAEHHQFDFPTLSKTLTELQSETNTLPELLPVLCEMMDLPESFRRALRHVELPLPQLETASGRKTLNGIYRQDRALGRLDGRTLAQGMSRLEKHYREWLGQNAACIRAGMRRQFLEHVNISGLPAGQLDNAQKIFKRNYSAGRRDLEHEFGKTMRYKSIRDLAAGNTGLVIRDLKPIWLMSPLSISDTLPLDPGMFDVVIFDEASQIPVEEAVPALYRAIQVIVVGDEMQLPPTTFFAARRAEEEETIVVEEEGERVEVDLDSDSFLTQSARNMPATLLAWHYRSRYEALISFSNAAFYTGNLFTIPDRQRLLSNRAPLEIGSLDGAAQNVTELLDRSISFHFMTNGVYAQRCNPEEARYIARLVRELLQRDTKLSIGIVAFSEAQQAEIEEALSQLAEDDAEFGARLESEYVREENDQFCGLFVKNLENVQGDERDIIILSICYGYDANRRMLMNFGPINQRGGEKRLNVIFSRAKHHMAIVSSIRHHDITNDYNDGANSLKNFLHYAEAVSGGDEAGARRVLENLNPLSRKSLAPATAKDAVIEDLAQALRKRGYEVDLNVGQSRFRCDLAIRKTTDALHQLGILVDTNAHYANPNLLDRYLMQPSILRAFGWRCVLVLTKDWFHEPEAVLDRIERDLAGKPENAELPDAPDEVERRPEGPAPMQARATAEPSAPANPEMARPAAEGSSRYFEFISEGSKKFWEITVGDTSFTVRFGRMGTAGQTQTKSFAESNVARDEAEKLIAEKVRKGYRERAGA